MIKCDSDPAFKFHSELLRHWPCIQISWWSDVTGILHWGSVAIFSMAHYWRFIVEALVSKCFHFPVLPECMSHFSGLGWLNSICLVLHFCMKCSCNKRHPIPPIRSHRHKISSEIRHAITRATLCIVLPPENVWPLAFTSLAFLCSAKCLQWVKDTDSGWLGFPCRSWTTGVGQEMQSYSISLQSQLKPSEPVTWLITHNNVGWHYIILAYMEQPLR